MLRIVILVGIFVILLIIGVVGTELRERRRAAGHLEPVHDVDANCCGQHLVCERETLLNSSDEIIYYDDENLDCYAHRSAESYTAAETADFEEVFNTLRDIDVAGWCRSLQLRGIELPYPVRDEALLIVREQRALHSSPA